YAPETLMPIQIRCEGCEKTAYVKDDWAGRDVKCRQCGTALLVPFAATEVPVDDAVIIEDAVVLDPGPPPSRVPALRAWDTTPRPREPRTSRPDNQSDGPTFFDRYSRLQWGLFLGAAGGVLITLFGTLADWETTGSFDPYSVSPSRGEIVRSVPNS